MSSMEKPSPTPAAPQSPMLKTTENKPLRPTSSAWRGRVAAAAMLWVRRQGERLALLGRALRPSDHDARETIWASLRRRALRRGMADDDEARRSHEIATERYQEWIRRFDGLSQSDKAAIRDHIAETDLPVPLAVFVFDAASARFADEAVRHLRQQLLSRFDALLCFASDCPEEALASARRAAKGDPRFTLSDAPLSAHGAMLARYDGVLLAEGGVLLREHALYMFLVSAPERVPSMVYADEDCLDIRGVRRRPHFKPSFSPELLRRADYIGPCAFFRGIDFDPDGVLQGGGVKSYIGQLAQRLGRGHVANTPFVLYHDARLSRPIAELPSEILLAEQELPSVSIIIPTKDRLDLLESCLASIESRTQYPRARYEIVVVDNGSRDPDTLRYLRQAAERGAIRLVRHAGPFNYARLNNLGVRHSSGEVLVLLNNDTLVDDPRWLELLVGQAMQPDVAAVGAKLLFPDRTVQFGGTILGIQGVAGHAHVGLREDDGGYRGVANTTHEVSAATGACLAIRRKVFEELGGLDPALAVACNDVQLCVEALKRGYRNIYIAQPLLVHLESRTRAYDDNQAKRELFLDEARYTRARHRGVFQNDPYYSPNLSYERSYDIAFPPRRDKPWRQHLRARGALRILMLSVVHEMGHGVPVVLQLQATHLARLGHEVFVGGPRVHQGIPYDGCQLVQLSDPAEAAAYAVAKDMDCVVAHTIPFFSMVRWIGDWPRCILYDYGEPNPSFFPDAELRHLQHVERKFCFGIADRVFAISAAVRAEMDREEVGVIRLGNSHLATWSDALLSRRRQTRAARRWDGKVVVLNVCRFQRAERRYKGVDIYAAVANRFRTDHPDLAGKIEFVLCGRATEADVAEVEAMGLSVAANVSDQEMIDLYAAADIYMNFSQWEGYNLGIGQALALGLPVIASDIPAHREFGITTSNDSEEVVKALKPLVERALSGELLRLRAAKLWTWDEPLAQFAATIEAACRS